MVLAASFFLSACSGRPETSNAGYPFDQEFISDVRAPLDEKDLRELLVTLPVWDIPPERILPWIHENGTLSEKSLLVSGDGAQTTLRLRELETPAHYELKIGTEDWPEGGLAYYTLKRVSNTWPQGWQVLSRR